MVFFSDVCWPGMASSPLDAGDGLAAGREKGPWVARLDAEKHKKHGSAQMDK